MNKSDLHSGMGEFHAPVMAPLVCPQPSPHTHWGGEGKGKSETNVAEAEWGGEGEERERAADATLADNAKLQGL